MGEVGSLDGSTRPGGGSAAHVRCGALPGYRRGRLSGSGLTVGLERYRLILDRTSQASLPPAKSRDFISHLARPLKEPSMPELHWQKSTYSQEASACVYLAATPAGTILLRESDEPGTVVTTGPRQLDALITALRSR